MDTSLTRIEQIAGFIGITVHQLLSTPQQVFQMTQTNNEDNVGSGTQNFYIDKELIAILKKELSNKNKHIEELLRLVK